MASWDIITRYIPVYLSTLALACNEFHLGLEPPVDNHYLWEFSVAVYSTSNYPGLPHLRPAQWVVSIAATFVLISGFVRYAQQPTFWLDEAFVAVSLRNPSFHIIFAPLEYGQFFPRVYLAFIAVIREVLGYRIWALRLLPMLSFAAGTLFWAFLLAKRSAEHLVLGLLGGGLLIGSSVWLEQSIQLKQYTLDVMLSLVPFLLDDQFINEQLIAGKRKVITVTLATGCILSYTYPIALGARLLGWYAFRFRRGWQVNRSAFILLIVSLVFAIGVVWLIDYRFNVVNREAYLEYWRGCIVHFDRDVNSAMRPVAKLLWGWHGRMPLMTAAMVTLQVLGLYQIFKIWRNAKKAEDRTGWGSRSLSGVLVLMGVILASTVVSYPICGRVVLFTEVHTQVLALEGTLFVLSFWVRVKPARFLVYGFTATVLFYSTQAYLKFNRGAHAEDLRPVISMIDPRVANTVWVHPCSVAQVRALPTSLSPERILLGQDVDAPPDDPRRYENPSEALDKWRQALHPCSVIQFSVSAKSLPIERVLSDESRGELQERKRAWIIWTHLGDKGCRESLNEIREQAQSWEVIYEAFDGGLALAEF